MAKLIINPTSSSRREIVLPRSLLSIGRDPSNDLVLPDAMVSRRHAVIEYRGNQFYLRDCNSSNGSLVNGDRVSERSLRDGDLVAIGTARLLFRDDLEIEDPSAKVVQHPSAPRLQCPSCGADYRKGDLFCRQCGAHLAPSAPPKVVCTSCGTVVPLPARFCNACGSPLQQPDSPEFTRPRSAPPELAAPPPLAAEPAVGPPAEGPPEAAAPPAAPALPEDDSTDTREPLRGVEPPRAARMTAAEPARPLPEPQRPAPPPVPPVPVAAPPPIAVPPPPPPPPPVAPVSSVGLPRPRPAAPPRIEPRPRAPEPAGLGPRLAAALVDCAIVGAILTVPLGLFVLLWWSREIPSSAAELPLLPILASVALAGLAFLAGGAYYVYFWGVKGATPGKSLFDLTVEGVDGERPIGLAKAFLRLVGYALSCATLGFGFLMIAFGGSGLHDRIAGTRVVRGRI